MATGSKLGIDATKKLPAEGFKRTVAAAYQDGCRGESEVGIFFDSRSLMAQEDFLPLSQKILFYDFTAE